MNSWFKTVHTFEIVYSSVGRKTEKAKEWVFRLVLYGCMQTVTDLTDVIHCKNEIVISIIQIVI